MRIPPRWQVVSKLEAVSSEGPAIVIGAGPGFGDGTHPTTQLCLQAIAALAPRGRAFRMLDFGSGSGVLSIGAALLAATVDAVEIDDASVTHARLNAIASGVEGRIRQTRELGAATDACNLVVANILRAVLVEFAPPLVDRVARGGTLVLSGLVATDVPHVSARYAPLLGGARPEVYEHDDWRALVWRKVDPDGR